MWVRLVNFVQVNVLAYLVPCRGVRYESIVFLQVPFVLKGSLGGIVLFMVFVFIYVRWHLSRFLYQMNFMSSYSNMTGASSGSGSIYHSESPKFTMVFSSPRKPQCQLI